MEHAETVEVIEIWSASSCRIWTTHIRHSSEASPVVVEYKRPIRAEYVAPAPAVTRAHVFIVVEYITAASAVAHAVPVTATTAAPTAFTADTLPGDCSQGTIAAGSCPCSRTSCACPLPPAMTQKAAPAMGQRQVPSAPRVAMPKVQFSDGEVNMPVVAQRQVPMIPNVQKTVEVPQIQYVDKIVDAPVVARVEDVSVGTQTVSRKRMLPLETESADGTSDSEHGLVQGGGEQE